MVNDGNKTPQVPRDETARVFVPGHRIFDRYTLKKTIGRGGMGVVWLARDEKLQRETALKFLPEIVWRNQESLADLRRETKRNLDLTHPNIVRIYDILESQEGAAISMEYVDGGSLSDRKAEREPACFEVAEIAGWVEQICAALDYAHRHAKIVHLDLKPANLLITTRGQLKISDFGIARSISETFHRTSMLAKPSGTLAYMSPQRLNGDRPCAADDIYGLGATIYELLTSRPPFYYGDITRQVEVRAPSTLAGRRQELGVKGAAIPDVWEETVAACLAKKPADRPQSAFEIAQRLGLNTGTAVNAPYFPHPPRFRWNQSHWIGLGIAATLLVLASSISLLGPSHSPSPNTPPRTLKAAATPSPMIKDGPIPGQPYTNKLGMKFVPVPGTKVYFSIWETRVQDFAAFVTATGHDAAREYLEFDAEGWNRITGHSWQEPGFPQTGDHAVCGVNWYDAQRFCEWLTEHERQAGRLTAHQGYRLPTEQEWEKAVGADRYPWGNNLPPPPGAGNYAGQEVLADGHWKRDEHNMVLPDYQDAYARTAPVGSFKPNALGLYDLGGNVWEWCQDADETREKRMQRGASWHNGNVVNLETSLRSAKIPTMRDEGSGFRCVLTGVAP